MRTRQGDRLRLTLVLASAAWLAGCATPAQNLTLGLVGATATLGTTATTNIVQTYYLGAFDPQDQLPPTIYRVRVQGQASALSTTKFASGWVRSDLVDSLSGRVNMEEAGVKVSGNAADKVTSLAQDKRSLDRRLVMFGPEGFREAPKNHRLVIAMGSSPETYFQAMDQALGIVAGVTQPSQTGPDVLRTLWPELARMRVERREMDTLVERIGRE